MTDALNVEVLQPEAIEKLIWSDILDWLNTDEGIKPETRELLLKRFPNLRLKLQALFVEIQKKLITQIALDVEFEATFRREMRRNLPYMTPTERAVTLKALIDTNEDRLQRLERQLAGFDLFSNIEFAISNMSSDNQIAVSIQDKAKKLTPIQRRNMLAVINEIKTQIEADTKDNLTNDDSK